MSSVVVLMIEEEQPEGLSTRKLVVETAKHNVITAYNKEDGLSLLRRFPKVDAVLIHDRLLDDENFIGEVKQTAPGVTVIVASPRDEFHEGTDFVVSSYDPQAVLSLLERVFVKMAESRAACPENSHALPPRWNTA